MKTKTLKVFMYIIVLTTDYQILYFQHFFFKYSDVKPTYQRIPKQIKQITQGSVHMQI